MVERQHTGHHRDAYCTTEVLSNRLAVEAALIFRIFNVQLIWKLPKIIAAFQAHRVGPKTWRYS